MPVSKMGSRKGKERDATVLYVHEDAVFPSFRSYVCGFVGITPDIPHISLVSILAGVIVFVLAPLFEAISLALPRLPNIPNIKNPLEFFQEPQIRSPPLDKAKITHRVLSNQRLHCLKEQRERRLEIHAVRCEENVRGVRKGACALAPRERRGVNGGKGRVEREVGLERWKYMRQIGDVDF